MKKEVVTFTPNGIPEPYNTYIRDRNANVGTKLAEIKGITFTGEYTSSARTPVNSYFVPAKTLQEDIAVNLGIRTSEDLYGGAVEKDIFATKAVLHPTLSRHSYMPSFFPLNFAKTLGKKGLTLPGYTTFDTSMEESYEIFDLLKSQGYGVRLKETDQSDGDGQVKINDIYHLQQLLQNCPSEKIIVKGLVFEANLNDAKTTSVGQTLINGKEYCHIARQKDIKADDRTIYGGAFLRIYRGNIEDLSLRFDYGLDTKTAVQQANLVHQSYGELNPKLSRASYDVLQGYDNKGNFLSGITDQTFRLGGSSPAEVLAIAHLNSQPVLDFVDAEVTLDYNPDLSEKHDGVVFLDQPTLRITAKLINY